MQAYLELLSQNSLKELKDGKNLLAFSGGVDSSALFYLLVEADVDFDIAIVDYRVRESSKDEVAYAKELAREYSKKCFIKEVVLEGSNFEKKARDARYDFFEEIIASHSYTNLITAHQLNDKVEWFLMQFTKGAGLVEILGFDEIKKRDEYSIIRPLIDATKDELLEFLEQYGIKYFIDESNFDEKYKRNYFRSSFANQLISDYSSGIRRSFEYLKRDMDKFDRDRVVYKEYSLVVIQRSSNELRDIDKSLKKMGYLLSSLQKDEIKKLDELVISDRFVISKNAHYIFISPYSKAIMDKKFKERCRVLNIPKKIRAYLFEDGLDLDYLSESFCSSRD